MSTAASGADDWLTGPEREFFEAYGADALVNSSYVKHPADLSRLAEIARKAGPPLQGRIETVVDALQRLKVTPEERAQFKAYQRRGVAEVQRQMGGMLLGGLLGKSPLEAAVDATDGIMKGANVTQVWQLQCDMLDRAFQAEQDIESARGQILDDLERRLGKPRPASDLGLSLVIEGRELKVAGTATTNVRDPVLQVTLHRKGGDGQWTNLNSASAALTRALGVQSMDAKAQLIGRALAARQERAMGRPYTRIMLLPTVEADGRLAVSLDVPATGALRVQRVEVRLVSGEGWFRDADLPGLPQAQAKAARIVEEDRSKALAARQQRGMNPMGGRTPARRRPLAPSRGPNRANGPQARSTPSTPPPASTRPDDADSPAPASPPAVATPATVAYETYQPGREITLGDPPTGRKVHKLVVCSPVGKGYRETGKVLQIEVGNSPVRLIAIAASDKSYVALGRDTIKHTSAMVLIPRALVVSIAE